MNTNELAKIVCQGVNAASKKIGAGAFDVHIFLQEDMPKLYGVHCDLSFGGTEIAEEAVREELPNALYVLKGEDIDSEFEAAMEEAWEEQDWAF